MQTKMFNNANHLWINTLAEIIDNGHILQSRNGECKEIIGFSAEIKNPINNIIFNPLRKFSLSYACAEVLWYLSGEKNIEMIQTYAPQYDRFAENGKAYGAYGDRWKNNPGFYQELNRYEDYACISDLKSDKNCNQLYALIKLLKQDPNTRQGIIIMWDSGDLIHAILKDHKDLPCTIALIFNIRNQNGIDRLYCNAIMRSNDAWLGLPYDIFAFTTIQRIIALELGIQLGEYHHYAVSEHLYKNNYKKIEDIFDNVDISSNMYDNTLQLKDYIESKRYTIYYNIGRVLQAEKHLRQGKSIFLLLETHFDMDSLYKDLLIGCATKFCKKEKINSEWFTNPIFQQLWQQQIEENKND